MTYILSAGIFPALAKWNSGPEGDWDTSIGMCPQRSLSMYAVSYRLRAVLQVYTRSIVKSQTWPSPPWDPATRYCGTCPPEPSGTRLSSNQATTCKSEELA